MKGAVNETIHEYFSEITKATKNDNNGRASAAKRQTSKNIEYVVGVCTL